MTEVPEAADAVARLWGSRYAPHSNIDYARYEIAVKWPELRAALDALVLASSAASGIRPQVRTAGMPAEAPGEYRAGIRRAGQPGERDPLVDEPLR